MSRALLQWALDNQPQEDYPTFPARKRALLAELNRACGTRYAETHLNCWLAGTKKLPGPAWRHLAAEYVEMVAFDRPRDAQEIIEMLGFRKA